MRSSIPILLAGIAVAILTAGCSPNELEMTDGQFYTEVVACTEAETGQDYGAMPLDQFGFLSTEAHRTVNEALEAAGDTYDDCFDRILSPRQSGLLGSLRSSEGAERSREY